MSHIRDIYIERQITLVVIPEFRRLVEFKIEYRKLKYLISRDTKYFVT